MCMLGPALAHIAHEQRTLQMHGFPTWENFRNQNSFRSSVLLRPILHAHVKFITIPN